LTPIGFAARLGSMGPKQEAARAAMDVAKDLGHEGIAAIEREAQRRRADACTRMAELQHRLGRLPRWRWLARAIARGQLGRAQDRCAALEATRR
jgi:hypothetical protein